MKKRGIIAWMLLGVLLLTACGGENGTPITEESQAESVTASQPEAVEGGIVLASEGKAMFEIIIPEDCDGSVIDAANDLKSALRSKVEAVFVVSDDFTRGGVVTDGSNEIVIGNCKRTASKSALEGLRYSDYRLAFAGSNLVIAGYDNERLVEAVNALIAMLDDGHLIKTGSEVRLKWEGDLHKVCESYTHESLTLGGVPLSSYRIVYPSDERADEYLEAAFTIQQSIGRRSGYVVDIVTDSETAQEYEILVGKTNREESTAYYSESEAVRELEYGLAIVGNKLQVACGGNFSVPFAAELLEKQLEALTAPVGVLDGIATAKKSLVNDASIPACKGEYRFMSYNILVEYEGWGSGGIIPSSVDIRKEAVAGLLLRYQADVVGLQEVSDKWSNELPELIDDVYEIVRVKRSDGTINAVPLLYKKDRLILVDSDSIDLGDKVGHITWGVFEDRQTGERFAYFSTHWDPRDDELKMSEAQIMADAVNALRERYEVPIFTSGDYNSGKSSDQVALFMEQSGLVLLSPSTGVDHIFGESYIEFVAGGIERSNYSQYASDHKPVWIDCTIA